MSKDTRENIQFEEIEYTYLSLMAHKLRVGIIGGGRVSLIKARNFIEKGSYIEILSKTFLQEFKDIESSNIVLNESLYKKDFIKDKHIIILALDDEILRKEVSLHCEEEFKIFIDCTNFKNGIAIMPIQKETSSINFAVSTKGGNPKGSQLACEYIFKTLKEYDDFIKYTGLIRQKVKKFTVHKKEIIKFINTEDFKFIWEKNKDEIVLKLFFGEDILQNL